MSGARLRFAPSPTGNLHIGSARTAIFNYLLARRLGGTYLLRIEDTDTQRSTPEFEADIIESLAWLGLTPDEEPLRQSTRLSFHREVVEELLERGAAFRCFVDPEEAQKIKDAAMEAGGLQAFRSPDRDLPRAESDERAKAGEPYAIRFRVNVDSIRYKDGVHGMVETPASQIDDFVIMRRDGTPTYQIAVVADDFEMGVTHVIRGDDHISNTPKQILIYEALGWQTPEFAHVPLILGPDKKRLSKRHGATAVREYRERGFLPEAMLSYVAMLGWSPKDDREALSLEELCESFDVSGINPRAAVFDEQKLEWTNAQFMSRLEDDELEVMLRPTFAQRVADGTYPKGSGPMLSKAVKLLKSRAHFPMDVLDKGAYFFTDPTEIEDAKAAKKRLKDPQTPEYLTKLVERFEVLDPFNEETTEEALRVLSEELEVGAGKLIHPTRLALSGMGSGPGLFELVDALGKETVIRRLNWLKSYLEEHGTPPQIGDDE